MTLGSDSVQVSEKLLSRFARRFHVGEVLFSEGDPAEEALLLHEGRVRLLKQVGSIERSLRVLRTGDLLGESALMAGSRRQHTAVALTDGLALALDEATIQHVLASYPGLGKRILNQLLERLQRAEDQIELLMVRDSQSKVVLALLKLLQPLVTASSERPTGLELSVSPMELSAMVGLDVETVKRNVQRLRESEYLDVVGERIIVPSVEPLRELYSLLGARDQLVGPPQGPLSRSPGVKTGTQTAPR